MEASAIQRRTTVPSLVDEDIREATGYLDPKQLDVTIGPRGGGIFIK